MNKSINLKMPTEKQLNKFYMLKNMFMNNCPEIYQKLHLDNTKPSDKSRAELGFLIQTMIDSYKSYTGEKELPIASNVKNSKLEVFYIHEKYVVNNLGENSIEFCFDFDNKTFVTSFGVGDRLNPKKEGVYIGRLVFENEIVKFNKNGVRTNFYKILFNRNWIRPTQILEDNEEKSSYSKKHIKIMENNEIMMFFLEQHKLFQKEAYEKLNFLIEKSNAKIEAMKKFEELRMFGLALNSEELKDYLDSIYKVFTFKDLAYQDEYINISSETITKSPPPG